jgi:hypothetical protein
VPLHPTKDDTGASDDADASSRWLLAAASAGAGIIHVSVILEHRDEAMMAVGFALVAWFQLATAYLLLRRPGSREVLGAMALGNLLALGAWALSRTTGLPFGLHDGVPEAAATLDITAAVLQATVVVLALAALLLDRPLSRQVSFAGAGALLALSTVAIVLPEDEAVPTSTVGSAAVAGDGHGHAHGGDAAPAAAGSPEEHAAQMLDIDRNRCDLAFNPQAFWDETRAMGVDTYAGGAMSPSDHGGSAITDVAASTQLGGRGSESLDALMSLASQSGGEVAGARFIAALAEASEAEYDAFRAWVRSTGEAGGHGHGAPEAEADGSITPVLTMGHISPSTWQAMVDPVACERLAEELDVARETAAQWPTVADAMADGYVQVTPYLPGIAAHFMRFGYVDGTFEITEPEMLLFGGTSPESQLVGLSYYVILEGEAQPTQGFTGDNDHYHRHFGLCIGEGGVIGDSSISDAECEAMGGRKSDGSAGWMSHAWVVPGCESPWGVFSGINPLLDQHLPAEGAGEGPCAGSSVRDRYDLSPGESDLLTVSGNDLAAADG